MGNCENLLKHHSLEQVFDLSVEDIANIEGFADLTAELIFNGLDSIKPQYEALISGGFELEKTIPLSQATKHNHPFQNKKIVFTGAMSQPRAALQKQAKAYGIGVSSSVSSKTDFLIIGENVGQSKLKAAKANDVAILTEEEYLKILTIK
jgi:DNA ligase (NAD+)